MTGKTVLQHSVVWTAGLIIGNLVGAGILALPVSLGLCGLLPSLLLMLLYGSLMFYSAEILAREAIERKNDFFDLPSLYGTYLGSSGKWIAVITNGIILYGLLVAYISGGAQIIADLLNMQSSKQFLVLGTALLLSFLAVLDLSVIHKYNAVLVGTLICAFAALLFLSFPAVDFHRLRENHWSYTFIAIPLVVTACHFHNIIPLLCKNLSWDLAAMRKAVLIGMFIALFMNILWTLCGIGTLPRHGSNSLIVAYISNLPATVPMGNLLKSPAFTVIAAFFSLTAIATSFIANGVGLMNFLRDLLSGTGGIRGKNSSWAVKLLVFLPPLVIALIKPEIFIKALDVVGGIGIVTLFGILPCIIALRRKGDSPFMRGAGAVFLIFSVLALLTAILSISGIKPAFVSESHTEHKGEKIIMKEEL